MGYFYSYSGNGPAKTSHTVEIDNDYPVIADVTAGIDKSSIMLHYHSYIEICYVKQGIGNYFIDGNDYSFQEGDIFIIGENEVHLAYNDKDVIIQVVLFDKGMLSNGTGYAFEIEGLLALREIRRRLLHKITPEAKYYDFMVEILNEISEENNSRNAGYKLIVKSLINKLIVYAERSLGLECGHDYTSREKTYDQFIPVFEYVKENYQKKITLDELAAIANMGVSNFSLVFKKVVGATPIEYLNKIRVVKASEMIIGTDRKIIVIANDCGFFSLPHFINCFKKYTGKTPRDFRKYKEKPGT